MVPFQKDCVFGLGRLERTLRCRFPGVWPRSVRDWWTVLGREYVNGGCRGSGTHVGIIYSPGGGVVVSWDQEGTVRYVVGT